ncbi:MAG: M6 family metalloprotease domain-containing protein [Prevotella sp.]|nr:M6 family metalloprotease domain-containing protein [Prevotella sp.]
MNTKRISFFALLLCLATSLVARPVKSEWRTVTQSDGTTLRVKYCGDEHFQFYQTSDGTKLVRAANGDFHYANTLGFQLSSTGVLAHEAEVRNAEERACVAAQGSISNFRVQNMAKRYAKTSVSYGDAVLPLISQPNRQLLSGGGAKRGLVIMVNFSDVKFVTDDPHQTWDDILNKEGYEGFESIPAKGSVHDYFYAQSNGQFDLSFDVIGPIDMPKASTYYGKNGSDLDVNAGELVAEACKAAVDQVNFKDYDWDGDGWVDQVFVLYAGYGEAVEGADANLLWPHKYQLRGYAAYRSGLQLDGVKVDAYAIGCELEGLPTSALRLTGLGTFCHEFSHCLGLVDVYDTEYSNGLDMMTSYDLMSEGWNNGKGFWPCNYTSYERMSCGWVNPVVLDKPATITEMKSISENGEFYLVRNDCSSSTVDEYYLIENRQKVGWDAQIPGSGVMILHVNYDEAKWFQNIVNNDINDLGLSYFPANNRWMSGKYTPYPYFSNDSLTDTSYPAANVYNYNLKNTKKMGKPITKIAVDANGLASFLFCGGVEATAITPAVADGKKRMDAFKGKHVIVFDEAGRKVDEQSVFMGIAHLPKGVYILRSNEGQIKIKR